ncbi:Multi antimicrobial extrusion protein matE (Na(+)/drug antiporter) [Candidatus Bipolaricaulis anaerobius]|jgi:putative MATE family efflux protein|uniref:Multi antimicrobial extrusion protein matE (Na(+)/drug antiporter) n=1 Tax=Candidatus Bipolaricaulis anaerobius TaxID=2026885 RepID=A0A2X3KJ05_9BACT|nr:MATE family efflux transporter [Candidatus Bipolaricaulis anaerobius]SQD92322.1 Multi antimicrobial extrusion protein matE (Na(+)/drug antiporter) [Candidatus Bipolaricaulis anaerobius]
MNPRYVREKILKGPILPTMLLLAWPAMLTGAVQALYNLVDAFWLGKLSTAAMAAPGMAWPILFFFMSFAGGFQAAGTAFVAQHYGAHDQKGAEESAGQILGFLALASVVLGATGFAAAPAVLRLIRAPEDLFPLALLYLRIECAGLPFMFLAQAFGGLMVGLGNTRLMMYLHVSSLLLNAVLDPLLIFGWGPFPEWGVAGAALATVLSRVLIAVVGLTILFSGRAGLRVHFRNLRPRRARLLPILRVGLPNVLDQTSSSLGFVVMMGLVSGFGTAVVASYTVGNRFINLVNVISLGAANALVAMIGQNLGADQTERAETIARRGITATFLSLIGVYCLAFFLRRPLFSVFVADPDVIREGSWFIAVFGTSIPFFGLFDGAAATFRGSGHTVPPMVMSIVRLWVLRVFLSWALAYPLGFGTTGMWAGMALSNFLAGIALVLWLGRGTWKKKVIRVPVAAQGATE